jgi:glycerate kinase
VISQTVLVAAEAFGEAASAERAAGAIGRGLQAGDPALAVDLCPIEEDRSDGSGDVRELLDGLGFDARMRGARAVVVATEHLDEGTLLGSPTFEIATRARQAGVPAYAVTGENRLNLFDTRILDLQAIVEARDAPALRRAGKQLAELV